MFLRQYQKITDSMANILEWLYRQPHEKITNGSFLNLTRGSVHIFNFETRLAELQYSRYTNDYSVTMPIALVWKATSRDFVPREHSHAIISGKMAAIIFSVFICSMAFPYEYQYPAAN